MMCQYHFQILPEGVIEKFESPIGRERGFLKIKSGTFFNILNELRIRPKAVSFARSRKSDFPTYAVIYSNGKVTECLFVLKFIKYAECNEYGVELTRCIGKTATKKRRAEVIDIILEYSGVIKGFEGSDFLEVNASEP